MTPRRLDASVQDGSVWSTAQKRRKTRASYGPYPKPNSCPVPHRLRDVPLERNGYPVPWVSDWTGTSDVPSDYRPVPGHPEWGDYNATEAGIGEGHALAGLLHSARQIRAMVQRLCGVCGRHVNGRAILIGGPNLVTQGFHEPPVHRDCARYAIQACPGINRGHPVVVEARTYDLIPIWGDAAGNTYRNKPPLVRLPVVAVAGLAAGDSSVYTMAEWARYTKTCPHPDLEGGFPEWSLSDLRTHPDAEVPDGPH